MRAAVAAILAGLLFCPATAPAQNKKDPKFDIGQIGSRDISKGKWNFYSPEREMELGRQLAQDAERTSHLLTDPFVVRYVAAVGERIARNSDLRVPLQVRVVNSGEVDAFALPGGYFFITTGMLLQVQTEAELAGVISHEIAHVAARHATRQMTRAQIWNLVSIPLVFAGGTVAYAIQQAASLAVPLTFLKFSRNSEKEADVLGLQYHYTSGYDPAAFVTFFERIRRLEKDERGGIARMFSSHPMTRDRIVAAERFIERHLPAREEYVVNTSEHDRIHKYLVEFLRQQELRESLTPVLRAQTESESKPELKKKP